MLRESGWQKFSAIGLDKTLVTARWHVTGSMGRGTSGRTCDLGLGREEELLELLRLQRLNAFQMIIASFVIDTEVLDLLVTNRFVGHLAGGQQSVIGS